MITTAVPLIGCLGPGPPRRQVKACLGQRRRPQKRRSPKVPEFVNCILPPAHPVLSVCAVLLCFFCASISDPLEKGRSFLLIRRRHHELPGLAEPSSRIEGWLTTTAGHLSQGLVRIAGSRDLTDLVAVFPCFAESETSFFLYPARWYAH